MSPEILMPAYYPIGATFGAVSIHFQSRYSATIVIAESDSERLRMMLDPATTWVVFVGFEKYVFEEVECQGVKPHLNVYLAKMKFKEVVITKFGPLEMWK
jgi:hypothetical protein